MTHRARRRSSRAVWALLTCLALALTPIPPAGASQTAIAIAPSAGHPLERTVVTGSGFVPGERVRLSFDRQAFGTVEADRRGSFLYRKRVPGGARPGPATIFALGSQSGSRATASFLVRTNWPMFRGGPGRTGYNRYENVLRPSNVSGLSTAWSFETGDSVRSSPAIVNGVLFVESFDGNVYALDAATGAEVWRFDTGTTDIPSGPAVADGVVYFGSNQPDDSVYAVDVSTGVELWKFSTGSLVYSSPVVVDGIVYAGSYDGKVYAIDASIGRKIWSFATGDAIGSSPAVAGGVVYVGSYDGRLYALNASTGVERWRFSQGVFYGSSPAVADGVVYAAAGDGNTYALDASSGAELWHAPGGGYSSPAVARGVVYVGSDDYKVHAIDASTGAELWTFVTGYAIHSSPAVANGVVYVGSWDDRLYALDAMTGAELWSFVTGSWVWSSPAVADGFVFVGSEDHKVYAFHLAG